jgi:hypothetical protein
MSIAPRTSTAKPAYLLLDHGSLMSLGLTFLHLLQVFLLTLALDLLLLLPLGLEHVLVTNFLLATRFFHFLELLGLAKISV